MPIVYVHGVGVRDPDDPAHETVEPLTRGAEWAEVESSLREHVAPVLRPQAPDRVELLRVYWGDLGAQPEDVVDPGQPVLDRTVVPAELEREELAEALQRKLFDELPPAIWPVAVRAVWEILHESSTRAQLAARTPRRQATWLEKHVRARMAEHEPDVAKRLTGLAAEWMAGRRHTRRWTLSGVRRPFDEVVPTFVGDVLSYLAGRGTPADPGPIPRRVLDTLRAAGSADIERGADEPVVVLSHSMGGQLVYDALTAFATVAADEGQGESGIPRVDLWCASASQVGLFAELGMFLRTESPALVPVPAERLGYFWNAWSSSDVLSFPAEGRVAGAHDADFAWPGTPTATHLAYLREEAFYRTFAAMIAAHCRPRRR